LSGHGHSPDRGSVAPAGAASTHDTGKTPENSLFFVAKNFFFEMLDSIFPMP